MPQGADETARLRAERLRRVGAGHEVPEYEDGWPVNAHAHEAELCDCSPLLADPPALRRHAERRGWLYFARLLPDAAVAALRSDLLGVAARHGWLADGEALDDAVPREGRFECEQVGSPAFRAYYADVQALRSFHALPHHPELLSALRALFACEHPFVHPRHIGHTVFPGGHQYTTPPHQDWHPVRGTPQTWTAWLPLGAVPHEMGGLQVHDGSHLLGLYCGHEDDSFVRSGVALPGSAGWLGRSTFHCGDVLLFHSLTAHRAAHNTSDGRAPGDDTSPSPRVGDNPGRIRLALSARYQHPEEPIDAAALTPHMGWSDWDDIYKGWAEGDRLKRYWEQGQGSPPTVGREEALQLLPAPRL